MEERQSEARERKSTSGWMKTMRSVKSPRETNEKTQRVSSATHDWSARGKFGAGAGACAISSSPTRRSLISFLLFHTLEYTCRGRRNPTITAIQPSNRWTISGRFAIFSCRDPPVTVLPWTGATRRISTAFTIFFPFFSHLSDRASCRLPNIFSVLVQSNPHILFSYASLFLGHFSCSYISSQQFVRTKPTTRCWNVQWLAKVSEYVHTCKNLLRV